MTRTKQTAQRGLGKLQPERDRSVSKPQKAKGRGQAALSLKTEHPEKKDTKDRSKSAAAEIDEIFGTAKKSAALPQDTDKPEARVNVKDDSDFADSRGVSNSGRRQTTEDGFPIYTAAELNIGKGGDTEDCPFDCECCH